MWKFLTEIVKFRDLAIIVLGSLMFVTASTGTVPGLNLAVENTWRIRLASVGVLIVIIGLASWILKSIPSLRIPRVPKGIVDREKSLQSGDSIEPKLQNIDAVASRKYKLISLRNGQHRDVYGLPHVPIGFLWFKGIPFHLEPQVDGDGNLRGHTTITVQPNPDSHAPQIASIIADVNPVSKIHLLITAGHGWTEYHGVTFLHKRIGYVEIEFADNTTEKHALVLGKHIREWSFGNDPNLVRDVDPEITQPVWVSYDSRHRIDVMTLALKGGPKHVKSVRIVVDFETKPDKAINTPAIMVSAVTCELGQAKKRSAR